ncbi:hypothetical protein [Pseudidiomarina sp.]|uniref:hypothetical protein n=1 Tax=Pseudidiomarina sp. TaxID=2081707 RepID=UPI00299F1E75|nr:hypothetical protein [Pseudidiomarina sp.]MDX1706943.1 hypothetical protein [Pseudidiomarina sp.]
MAGKWTGILAALVSTEIVSALEKRKERKLRDEWENSIDDFDDDLDEYDDFDDIDQEVETGPPDSTLSYKELYEYELERNKALGAELNWTIQFLNFAQVGNNLSEYVELAERGEISDSEHHYLLLRDSMVSTMTDKAFDGIDLTDECHRQVEWRLLSSLRAVAELGAVMDMELCSYQIERAIQNITQFYIWSYLNRHGLSEFDLECRLPAVAGEEQRAYVYEQLDGHWPSLVTYIQSNLDEAVTNFICYHNEIANEKDWPLLPSDLLMPSDAPDEEVEQLIVTYIAEGLNDRYDPDESNLWGTVLDRA